MRILLSLLMLVVCFGCSTHRAKEEITRVQMSHLQKGMTDQGVLKILGKPVEVQKHEEFVVWFYVTQSILPQEKLSDKHLTPIVFKDGYLMDWGYFYYNYLLGEEAVKKATTLSYAETKAPSIQSLPPPEAPADKEMAPETPMPPEEGVKSEKAVPKKEDACDHKALWE